MTKGLVLPLLLAASAAAVCCFVMYLNLLSLARAAAWTTGRPTRLALAQENIGCGRPASSAGPLAVQLPRLLAAAAAATATTTASTTRLGRAGRADRRRAATAAAA